MPLEKRCNFCEMEMNTGYITEQNIGIGIPHHISSPMHHGSSFINNTHHSNNIAHQTHLQLGKCTPNFEPSKLPLINQLENQPAVYNARQNTYSNQSHISLPTKPCVDTIDGNSYFHFTESTHSLGK